MFSRRNWDENVEKYDGNKKLRGDQERRHKSNSMCGKYM